MCVYLSPLRYKGKGKKKLISGFVCHYAEIPVCKESASKFGMKEFQKRVKISMKFVSKLKDQ